MDWLIMDVHDEYLKILATLILGLNIQAVQKYLSISK